MAKIFIASSSESKSVASTIQEILVDHEVTVWDQDVFKLSTYPLEALERELDKGEFAIFLFTPIDLAIIHGQEKKVVRDNVIFELGMFIGRFSRHKCFIVAPKGEDLHLPTDLIGLTLAHYDPSRGNQIAALTPACNKIKRAIQQAPAIVGSTEADSKAKLEGLNDDDIVAILKDYVNRADQDLYIFAEVDQKLHLPSGSAKRLLIKAASEWLDVDVAGEATVRFKDKDYSSGDSGNNWFNRVF